MVNKMIDWENAPEIVSDIYDSFEEIGGYIIGYGNISEVVDKVIEYYVNEEGCIVTLEDEKKLTLLVGTEIDQRASAEHKVALLDVLSKNGLFPPNVSYEDVEVFVYSSNKDRISIDKTFNFYYYVGSEICSADFLMIEDSEEVLKSVVKTLNQSRVFSDKQINAIVSDDTQLGYYLGSWDAKGWYVKVELHGKRYRLYMIE